MTGALATPALGRMPKISGIPWRQSKKPRTFCPVHDPCYCLRLGCCENGLWS